MNLRRQVLLVVVLAVLFSAGSLAWLVSVRARRAFDAADAERAGALFKQVQQEFDFRGQEVVQRLEGVAASESVFSMAQDLSHGADVAPYVTEAKPAAETHQLDFLEFVGADGAIISSAQWPARFGYKENLPPVSAGKAFLKQEETPDGTVLGLFALRALTVEDHPLFLIGGKRVDREFLSTLALSQGMRVLLYRNREAAFSPAALLSYPSLDPSLQDAANLAPLIQKVQTTAYEAHTTVNWSNDPGDSERFQAMPLKGDDGALLGILLVGSSRRSLAKLQRQIRTGVMAVGGCGILFAILVSSWVTARVAKPIDQLARAAREVSAGHWDTEVRVSSRDELGQLASAFNRMTRELLQQRERLVQSERVAAWRELARRLAHELKNPLFPLQITVENLVRCRESAPAMFDEVFRESTSTLLAELTNLKAIIGRFSDFSKMPQPQLQRVQVNEIVRQVVALHEAQFHVEGKPDVTGQLELEESLPEIQADPDLLHRALSNLVLNALDVMPEGGTLTIRTRSHEDSVRVEIADSGSGLTPEECSRLFTPYYTTKHHGTGLGLAIVQSVVSDHQGSIAVESTPGKGTTFRIDLPKSFTGEDTERGSV